MEDVLRQYETTVKPMHDQWVEPSKLQADLIVNSMMKRTNVAMQVLMDYVRLKTGLL